MEYKHFLTWLQDTMYRNWDTKSLMNYQKNGYTYGEVAEMIARYHILFEKMGVVKGDKIALSDNNTAEWAIAFMAVTTYEAVVVPILNDFTDENTQSLVEHSEAKLLLTNATKWNRMDISKFTHLMYVVSVIEHKILYVRSNGEIVEGEDCKTIVTDAFEVKYPNGFSKDDVHYPVDNFDQLAIINYTSGTTSAPKGVMLTYGNLSSNIQFAMDKIPNIKGETILSMLPMAHMYGLAFEFIYPFCGGVTVYFLGKIPSPNVLFKAFGDVKPYILITVPLVIEKIFQKGVLPTLDKPFVKFLLHTPFRGIIYKSVHDKILKALGGNIRHIVAGGAAMNKQVEDVLRKCKLPYTIGYGMTECAPLLAYEDWHYFAKGSCGKPTHRMEVRIDSEDPQHKDGEIQVRGANVMMGYYKNEEATKAIFTKDGWMRTGDLGIMDADGNIFIRGRSKNMILSSNGQNIYPEEIEDALNSERLIAETVVVERDKKLVALIYPDPEVVALEKLSKHQVAQHLEECRLRVNKTLPAYSQIQKIEIRDEEFIKTPKKSIKRFLYK